MLAEQRRGLILSIVAEKGAASIADLHRRLKVSRETIRRDLTRLDRENRLLKTHGGALSRDTVEPAFVERMSVNAEGKRAIGRAAAALVPDGATVILDSGTTIQGLVEALMNARRLTIITNDIQAATRMAGRNENRVLMLGGEVVAGEGAVMGRDATAMLGTYFADFSFVGAGALSTHPWLMDFSREAAEIRGQMLAMARWPVVLADHTKFGRTAPVRVPNLERVRHIVVDKAPGGAFADALKRLDAEVLVAETIA
ncbi:MAG: DeoR/GlpR family DNA-binding transcription regulator [Rhodospirillales bacterium]|jgi:DeoR/GlpR family transcriptional regulator of sugar metabolism|nr:DeoR/GlpR family DNA-binding transcription regulator [Rhodospirillales bacterium]